MLGLLAGSMQIIDCSRCCSSKKEVLSDVSDKEYTVSLLPSDDDEIVSFTSSDEDIF